MKTLKCMTRFLASVAMVLATVSSPLAQMHEEPFMKTLEDVSRTIDRLIKMSAESGDAGAQFYFGRMYDSGRGVPEDDVEAARWYRMAFVQQRRAAAAQFAFPSAKADSCGAYSGAK